MIVYFTATVTGHTGDVRNVNTQSPFDIEQHQEIKDRNTYQGSRKKRESESESPKRRICLKQPGFHIRGVRFFWKTRILTKQVLWDCNISSYNTLFRHIAPLSLFSLNPRHPHLSRTHQSRPPMLHPQPF